MTPKGFSLGVALKDAVGFIPKGVKAAWAALLLVWALSLTASNGVLAWLPFGGAQPFVLVALALAVLMAEGALYRTALFGSYAHAEGIGWGGLQFAKPELRLIGAALLVAAFMAFIAAVLVVVIGLGLNASGIMTPDMNFPHDLLRYHGKATLIVVAALLFSLIFLVYLSFRLSLYKAATVAVHQVVSLNALSLSGGQAFKLFLGVFILGLPVIATIALFMSPLIFVLGDAVRPHVKAVSLGGGAVRLGFIAQAGLKAIAIGLVLPALCGFFSSAYRQTAAVRSKEGA